MASAVGMAVLDVIEEDGCQEISDRVGTHLLKGLENLRSEFEVSTHLLSSIYSDRHSRMDFTPRFDIFPL